MKPVIKPLLFASCLLASSFASAELFDSTNNPQNFRRVVGKELSRELEALPLEGELLDETLGWSGSFWPSNLGGAAFRWSHEAPNPFKYSLLSREEVAGATPEELAKLSPTELYDIALGDYAYTLTKTVLSRYSARDLWWDGINHGWAQASSHYQLPQSTVVINPEGVSVPFTATDVAALLSLHEAYNYGGKSAFVGSRCQVSGKVPGESDYRDLNPSFPALELANSKNCIDVNAGSFHVILTNMIGRFSESFVLDVDRFSDVYNHPVKAYKSEIVGEAEVSAAEVAHGIARKVIVKTSMTIAEMVRAGAAFDIQSKRHYEYILELSPEGKVIGGEWISQSRPDFIWKYQKSESFVNGRLPLAGLSKIYQ